MQQETVLIHFGWTVPADPSGESTAPIPGVTESSAVETPSHADPDVADLLDSVGLQRDQQDVEELRPHVRMVGEIAVQMLGDTIERRASEAHTGLIVDLRFGSFEIVEHPSVGRGTVVLVDGAGAQLLSVRQGAKIADVIAAAASSTA